MPGAAAPTKTTEILLAYDPGPYSEVFSPPRTRGKLDSEAPALLT
jgi:hypothetical protein